MIVDLTAKQRSSVLAATAKLNLWHGAVRSGKTVGSEIAWLRHVRSGPAGDLLMVGKTERTLRRNVLNPLQQFLGSKRMKVSGSGEAMILGRRVYLLGANDARAEEKIRGLTLAGGYGDEVSTWPATAFRMLLSRISVGGAALFATTNPDSPFHWLKRDYLDRSSDSDLAAFQFAIDDNPKLDPEFVSWLKRQYTGVWYRRFILGEWAVAEGVIWDAFDPDRHVVDAVPEGVSFKRYVVGIDYGTSNPFVAILLGHGSDRRVWALDSWRWDSREKGRQLSDAEYSSAIKRWLAQRGVSPSRIWVDPSAASFIVQARQDGLAGVEAADNAVADGIRSVSTLLANDGIRIVRSGCEHLIQSIASYRWDEKAQARGEDEPLKVDDHDCDALRYPVYSEIARRPAFAVYAERQLAARGAA